MICKLCGSEYSNLEVNLLKRQACIDLGYKFWFTVGV